MKVMTKRKSVIVLLITVLTALLALVLTVNFSESTQSPQAEVCNLAKHFTFTSIKDDEGNITSYKVSIRGSYKSKATSATVPDTNKGLPVTELADNAFEACINLNSVVLPDSIKTIGSNAFAGCSQLESVYMPAVESIGDEAFSGCTALKRIYIPDSVRSVGANVFNNNTTKIFVQSAEENLGNGWSDSWNDLNSGEVVYGASSENSLVYDEVYNENNELVGYEICEGQFMSTSSGDAVIYNAYRPDETSDYLPVLNICQNAFEGIALNSLTIKDKTVGDDGFTGFDKAHKINIMSYAFYSSIIKNIDIETDVEFTNPQNAEEQGEPSTSVFEESHVESVTLPASLDAVNENMFYNCIYLSTIKIAGQEYDGTNKLPNIRSIADCAFNACVSLKNIFIPSTVENIGETAFSEWGTGEAKQEIYIDMFKKDVPESWITAIEECSDSVNTKVEFKEWTVFIDLCDGNNGKLKVVVMPGEQMPNIAVPPREGHIFKGAFTEPNGYGTPYYTNTGTTEKVWNEGDLTVLYANWEACTYTVELKSGEEVLAQVGAEYGKPMHAVGMPEKTGYTFLGYYYPESDGSRTFYYNADMSSSRNYDKAENIALQAAWKATVYKITYVNLYGGTHPSQNPTEYTIESDDIKFFLPYNRNGYDGSWDISVIPHGSTGDKKITAIWKPIEYVITYIDEKHGINPNTAIRTYTIETPTIVLEKPYGVPGYEGSWDITTIPQGCTGHLEIHAVWKAIEYKITYYDTKNGINPNSAITTYTIETPTIVFAAPCGVDGYDGAWDIPEIQQGSMGDIKITAVWTTTEYEIKYENLQGGVNPNSRVDYNIEDPTIVFENPYGREGYIGSWDIKEIPHGSTEAKTITAVWTPIQYKIEYDISYGTNPNAHITSYTIESETINFAPPYGRDYYTGVWDIISIPKGSIGDKKITAVWTPIQYNITYKNVDGLNNSNPAKITCEDVVTLNYVRKSGFMLVGWKLNDEYVETLKNVHQDITLVAVWSDGKVVNLDTKLRNLLVHVDDMTINLPNHDYSYGALNIVVQGNVEKLTVSSRYGLMYCMNIDMSSHHLNLDLVLNSVKMISPSASTPTIRKPYNTLSITANGTCGIYGYNGRNGLYPTDTDLNAGAAIYCLDVRFKKADNLTVKGGDGGNGYFQGGSGGNGAYALDVWGTVYVYTDNVTLIGGNGGDGGYGAASYGVGSNASRKAVENTNGYSITIIDGNDGKIAS